MEPLPAPPPRDDRAPAPSVRLYDGSPSHGGTTLTDQATLPEIWFHGLRPLRTAVRKTRTIDQYDQSIGYWQKHSPNPPVALIDDVVLADFVGALASLPSIGSPNTVRKHCTHLQAVLDHAGPRSRRRPKALRLLDFVPVFEKPLELETDSDDGYTLDEVTLALEHCPRAVAPFPDYDEHRIVWWESLFLVAWNTFLRAGGLMDAQWANLRPDAVGWVLKVREKGNRVRNIRVNDHALAAIERLRPLTGHTPKIFHWPHQMNWLHDNCRRVLAPLPEGRRFGLHAFRRGGITELSKVDPLAAQMQAGHTKESTTRKFYITPQRVHEALQLLPQPVLPTRGPRQLDLF